MATYSNGNEYAKQILICAWNADSDHRNTPYVIHSLQRNILYLLQVIIKTLWSPQDRFPPFSDLRSSNFFLAQTFFPGFSFDDVGDNTDLRP